MSERTLLLEISSPPPKTNELSIIQSIICIIDVFGVFPVIVLPKIIIDCGFYGTFIVVIVCLIQIYTANLLGRCWLLLSNNYDQNGSIQKKTRYPYIAIAEFTYGKFLSKIISFLLDLAIFFSGIPNLILASQNLQLLLNQFIVNNPLTSYCLWIVILGVFLCPILWLGSPKDMKLVCSFSTILVVLVFLLVDYCLISANIDNSETDQIGSIPEKSLFESIFIAYGVVAFQFDIHPSILTIQMDMRDKSKLKRAIIGGFVAALVMFLITSIVVTTRFDTNQIKSSILDTLQNTTLSTKFLLYLAIICIILQLLLTSAISNSALYQHIEDCLQISKRFNHRRCVLRTLLTFFCILLSVLVPNFDIIMSFIGGTLTSPLIFIFPSLFYIKLLCLIDERKQEELIMDRLSEEICNGNREKAKIGQEQEEDNIDRIITNVINNDQKLFKLSLENIEIYFCCLIVIVSCVCTVITTYVNYKNFIIFTNFSQPCIYNISSILI